jgi:2-dehydro-3-deoxygalactonokinase
MAGPDTSQKAVLIAVDWGTSRLRAYLVASDGRSLDKVESGEGIGQLDGGHEAVFDRLTAQWPRLPAIMAGMVGSRQGWREAPYVPCPADAATIGANLVRFETVAGRPIAIVPGVALRSATRDGDVIRGEETQMIGLIDARPDFAGTIVLPGTHSKWAHIAEGAIAGFQTLMTGELFEHLSRVSFLRHSVAASDRELADIADFRIGVERTARDGLPFLAALFSVRARQLLSGVERSDNLAYLSGLVIGGEIAAAMQLQPLDRERPVSIVGSKSLARAYAAAFRILGFQTETLDGDRLVLDGLLHLAREAGFLPGRKT